MSRIPSLMTAAALVSLLVTSCGGGTEPSPTPSASGSATPSPTASATVSPSSSPSSTSPSSPATPTPTPTSLACSSFGSTTEKSYSFPTTMSSLTGETMRTGRHDCYDRFVFEMQGTGVQPGWLVRYTDRATILASDKEVDLLGDAMIEVLVNVATWPEDFATEQGLDPYVGPERIVPSGYPALREVINFYHFEAQTQIVIGVDRRRPFRAFWLDGPPRLVVDVYTGS